MSPRAFATTSSESVAAIVNRFWALAGTQVRDGRLARGWTVAELAARARVSTATVYLVERGQPTSVEALARLSHALGLRPEIELVDPRRTVRGQRLADIVHSAMGELEAGHLRRLGYPVGLDEPYQHYQFAGRADVVSWDLGARALLHIENRTRFLDLQAAAGAYNAKRAYLADSLAARLGVKSWRSVSHVMACLWSSEVLRVIRSRSESFRSLCPDGPEALDGWWRGAPPPTGTTSALVVLDPLAGARQRERVGLEVALTARPRHAGYAAVAGRLGR